MLASVFIVQGYQRLRHPEHVAKEAEPVVKSLARWLDLVPDDTEQAVRGRAGVHSARREFSSVAKAARVSGRAGLQAGQAYRPGS
jgi:hypothetical protein